MEIYNLKTFDEKVSAKKSERAKNASEPGTANGEFGNKTTLRTVDNKPDNQTILRITDIKAAIKNENRVNIFVNDEYAFSLDIAQVVDFKIKVGRELSKTELQELKTASEFGKLYQRTLEWVLMRPRSVRETKDYLYKKLNEPVLKRSKKDNKIEISPPKFSKEKAEELSAEIIARLTAKNYLNDENFAKFYVENRFVKKGVSAKRLKMELVKKGVASPLIEEILQNSERDDATEIKKIIFKKRKKYSDEKLIQYLCRQGFPFELVQELVRTSGTD